MDLTTIHCSECGSDIACPVCASKAVVEQRADNSQSDAIALLQRWSMGWNNGSGLQTIYEDTKRYLAGVAQQHT